MQELENVKILTYNDYYDGPISGLCEYQNKWHWYIWNNYEKYVQYQDDANLNVDMHSERIYSGYELLNYQLVYELYWHALFSTNIKYYTAFDKSLVNELFKLNEDFYEKQKREYIKMDYSQNKIIGWFEKYIVDLK